MAYTGERYNMVRYAGQSLAIIECGVTICDSKHYVPPRIYPNHSVTFILSGKGVYVVGDETYELSEGQGFMITPDTVCSYMADDNEPWTYIYVIFSGSDAETIAHNAGLDENSLIFDFDLREDFINLLYSIHSSCREQTAMGYEAIGYFMLVMAELIEKNISVKEAYSSAEVYIKKAIRYIKQHYSYHITINELAAYIGFDRTYLYRLFMENFKKSPSEYINDYRLKKAVEMMDNKQLTLPNIALSTGFYDYSYFSKQFKKKYHESPGAYRREMQIEEK